MTTAKYYTPLGVEIHGKGISPDIEAGPPPNPEKKDQAKAKAPKPSKQPRKLPKSLDDPTFGDDDDALQLALRTLKKTKSAVVEVLRLTALQVQSRMARRARGISQAQVPGGQSLRP
jgi:hypothetical protein